jgi:hypothetical protein
VDGLRGARSVLDEVAAAGFRYVSSKAWGPDWSLPALLEHPFAYADDGHPELLELPCSGWHENVLKGNTWAGRFTRLIAFPAPYPEATPLRPVETPEEEFAINKAFINRAAEGGYEHVSLIWHPWSLARFDPGMKMLELTFAYARERGLRFGTYADLWQMVRGEQR